MHTLPVAGAMAAILLGGIFTAITYTENDKRLLTAMQAETAYNNVATVKFAQYNKICGDCHFPYQPGLLPAVSWKKLMTGTDTHFGTRLGLTAVEYRTMTRYLLDNAAGRVENELSVAIVRSLPSNTVITRVTQTPYILKVHGSLSRDRKTQQCDACHHKARQGLYGSSNQRQTDINLESTQPR